MRSNSAAEAVAAIAAGLTALADVDWAGMAVRERLVVMELVETERRRALAISGSIAATVADGDIASLADTPKMLIADVLRITPAESGRRLKQAELLRERAAATGEALAPHLPATAEQWNTGALDADHVREIETFFDEIPVDTPPDLKESSERFLAEKATQVRPDQLKRLAKKLALTINPDGKFSDEDRRRKSSFHWTSQRSDGMSRGVLWATPQLRAHMDAFFAKFAEPGMCMPDDHQFSTNQPEGGAADSAAADEGAAPADEGAAPAGDAMRPSDETSNRTPSPDTATDAERDAAPSAAPDFRTPSQRRHDALNFWMRSVLGNPALGTHHGLPLTTVVTATLAELEAAAGVALTSGGTVLPMAELIRLASKSYHYLAIFDDADRRVLDLFRARRCASGDQWLAMFARDRGCTKPGCDKPADACQAHHTPDYAANGQTNINMMGLACYADHPKVKPGGWTTSMSGGTTEWTPPAHYPRNTPKSNDFHHPERELGRERKRGRERGQREFLSGDDEDTG